MAFQNKKGVYTILFRTGPMASGMVERFSGRIGEVLQSRHVRSGEDLETTLHRHVRLYTRQRPQSALAGDERVAQTQAGAVQEAPILPSGT